MRDLEPFQQAHETRIVPDRIQKRVFFKPRIARESCIGGTLEPGEAGAWVAKLRHGCAKAVRDVVIHVGTVLDRRDSARASFSIPSAASTEANGLVRGRPGFRHA